MIFLIHQKQVGGGQEGLIPTRTGVDNKGGVTVTIGEKYGNIVQKSCRGPQRETVPIECGRRSLVAACKGTFRPRQKCMEHHGAREVEKRGGRDLLLSLNCSKCTWSGMCNVHMCNVHMSRALTGSKGVDLQEGSKYFFPPLN